jgi:hypothetical protein
MSEDIAEIFTFPTAVWLWPMKSEMTSVPTITRSSLLRHAVLLHSHLPLNPCALPISMLFAAISPITLKKKFGSSKNLWKHFARDLPPEGDMALPKRFFGDGGYLDNRPFSYAVEMLSKRQADMPVDRKLIYIEPSPEHPECSNNKEVISRKPDAIENMMAALMKIPRHETIREDLQRVLELNNRIGRMNRILSGIERMTFVCALPQRRPQRRPQMGSPGPIGYDPAKGHEL